MKPYSTTKNHNVWRVVGIVLATVFAIWFYMGMQKSMNGLEQDRASDFKRYESYAKQHNCERRLERHGGGDDPNDFRPYFYCDNGVWNEKDFVEVANGRIPRQ